MPDAPVALAVLALGVVCSGIAYLLYFRLVADVGAASALTVTFLVPVFGVLWGHLFLAEPLGWNTLAGALVVIVGTALVTGFRVSALFAGYAEAPGEASTRAARSKPADGGSPVDRVNRTPFGATSSRALHATRQQNRRMHPPFQDPCRWLRCCRPRAGVAGRRADACRHPAATITCPPTLVETPVVSSVVAGWEVDVRAGRRTLADAAVQVSRGSDRGGVPPDATARSGRAETAWWTLAPGDGSVYWVACSYGNTSALLLQRIPDTARRCVATHDVLRRGGT